jgi:hypothetical protein
MRTTLRHIADDLDWRWLAGILASSTLAAFVLTAAHAPVPIVALVFGSLAAMVVPAVRSLIAPVPSGRASDASAQLTPEPSPIRDERRTDPTGSASEDLGVEPTGDSAIAALRAKLDQRLEQQASALTELLQEQVAALRADLGQRLEQQASALTEPLQGRIAELTLELYRLERHTGTLFSEALLEQLRAGLSHHQPNLWKTTSAFQRGELLQWHPTDPQREWQLLDLDLAAGDVLAHSSFALRPGQLTLAFETEIEERTGTIAQSLPWAELAPVLSVIHLLALGTRLRELNDDPSRR